MNKRFLGATLALTLAFPNCTSVFGSTTSQVYVAAEATVEAGEAIKVNGDYNKIYIQPADEIVSGSEIYLDISNGSFSQELLEECQYKSYNGSSYDDVLSYNSYDPEAGLINYVGSMNKRELPYKLEYIDSDTLKVELYPIDSKWVNQNNSGWDSVTRGIPVYAVSIPAAAGSNGYTSVSVAQSNTVINEGGSYIIARVSGAEPKYTIKDSVKMGQISETKDGISFAPLNITPITGVSRNSYVYINVKNGSFSQELLDECQYKSYSGVGYDTVLNYNSYDPEAGLISYVGECNQRELPYKLEYVDSDTLKVELYPIDSQWVNQNNSGGPYSVTKGKPVYSIMLPIVPSGDISSTLIAVDGNGSTIPTAGWYSVNEYSDESEVCIVTPAVEGMDGIVTEYLALTIKPTNEVKSGSEIYLDVSNGSFSQELLEKYPYETYTGKSYDDVLNYSSADSEAGLISYVGQCNQRELPYKLEYVDSDTMKVTLYPIASKWVNQNNSGSGEVTKGTPVYKIYLPLSLGSEKGYTKVSVSKSNTVVAVGNSYTAARIGGAEAEYEVKDSVYVSVGSPSYTEAGEAVKDSRGDYITLNIKPMDTVVSNSSVTVSLKNGSFSQKLFEECQYKSYYGTNYDTVLNYNSSDPEAGLMAYIGAENKRELPYKLEYVNSDTLKVNLYPIDGRWVNQNNSGYGAATLGIPIYSIPLPAVANGTGNVQVAVDGAYHPYSTTVYDSNSDLTYAVFGADSTAYSDDYTFATGVETAGWYTIAKNSGGVETSTETTTQDASTVLTETTTETTTADDSTETTTADGSTETTTKKTSGSSGGGGGGGAVINNSNTTVATEATTEDTSTRESSSEGTTTAAATQVSVLPVNPPKADGEMPMFEDVPSTHWAYNAIETLAKAGIVTGITKDEFGIDDYSKRADFAVMIVKALGLASLSADNFSDVSPDKYYTDSVATGKAYGIVKGYGDNTFKPENNITREEMMVIVASALDLMGTQLNSDEACLEGFDDSANISDWAKPYVAALVNAGIVNGSDGKINPANDITRAETAQLVVGIYNEALRLAE